MNNIRPALSGGKEKAMRSRVFVNDKRKVVRVGLDHVAVDTDLKALALLSQCLCKHELTHPVNTVITVLDGKVVCLACAVNSFSRDGASRLDVTFALAKSRGVLLLRNELESKCANRVALLTAVATTRKVHCFE